MLYLIKSADRKRGAERLLSLKNSLLKKRENAQSFSLDDENCNKNTIRELVSGADLFAGRFVVVGKYLFNEKETKETVEEFLKEMALSENIFILLESSLDKPLEKKIEKYAEKIESIGGEKKDKKEFKLFALTDALGEKDEQKAWLCYHEALMAGERPEEISGVLFWQTKSILLSSRTKDATAAGMKSFPYQKAKKYSLNFSPAEMENLNSGIIELYHEARRGGLELELALEKFLLAL